MSPVLASGSQNSKKENTSWLENWLTGKSLKLETGKISQSVDQ